MSREWECTLILQLGVLCWNPELRSVERTMDKTEDGNVNWGGGGGGEGEEVETMGSEAGLGGKME